MNKKERFHTMNKKPLSSTPDSHRKVLLITADQWRGDCLGIAGHPLWSKHQIWTVWLQKE